MLLHKLCDLMRFDVSYIQINHVKGLENCSFPVKKECVLPFFHVTNVFGMMCKPNVFVTTTLQSMKNAKLSQHRFWPCHENGLIKTIQTIPHNLYVSFKLAFIYCGLG